MSTNDLELHELDIHPSDTYGLAPSSSRPRGLSSSLRSSPRMSPRARLPELHLPHDPALITSLEPEPSVHLPSSRNSTHLDGEDSPTLFIPALPPVDTGRDAWLYLAGATVCEMLVFGLPFSIGVLQLYWTEMFGEESRGIVTLASTLQAGLLYFSTAAFGPLFTAYPRYTKHTQYVALAIASAAWIGAAFATKPWHLVLTIGCLYPFAGATYMPCAMFLFEWFSQRRGLAAGTLWSGTGLGGTVFPFLISFLLSRIGYKGTMLSLGIGFFIVNGIAIMWVKRRIPLPRRGVESERRPTRMDTSCLWTKEMAFGLAVIGLTSLGNYVPSVWLPSFAEDLHLKRPNGTVLVALMNAASVPGTLCFGLLSDHIPIRYTILVNCILASLACAFLWGFGTNEGLLVAYSLAWGLTGLSFVGSWSKIVSLVSGENHKSAVLVFSLYTAVKGGGNFSSGPLSNALLKLDTFRGGVGAYGVKNYGVLLMYTGIVMFFGGVCGVGLRNKSRAP